MSLSIVLQDTQDGSKSIGEHIAGIFVHIWDMLVRESLMLWE